MKKLLLVLILLLVGCENPVEPGLNYDYDIREMSGVKNYPTLCIIVYCNDGIEVYQKGIKLLEHPFYKNSFFMNCDRSNIIIKHNNKEQIIRLVAY